MSRASELGNRGHQLMGSKMGCPSIKRSGFRVSHQVRIGVRPATQRVEVEGAGSGRLTTT